MQTTFTLPSRAALAVPGGRATRTGLADRPALHAQAASPRMRPPSCPAPPRRRTAVAALGSEETDDAFITTAEGFDAHIASADVVVADFMARWCRKCIYIKPKLVTLLSSKFPAVPLAFIDVNAVPSAVISGAGVTKMPTIIVFVKGKAVGSYIAGESASTAVLAVEKMVADAVKASKVAG